MTPETPTTIGKKVADQILSRYWISKLFDHEQRDLVDIIAAALAIPPGHVRGEDLVDRKVLGTLPLTADGCVVGLDAGDLYHPGYSGGFTMSPRENGHTSETTMVYFGSFRFPANQCYLSRDTGTLRIAVDANPANMHSPGYKCRRCDKCYGNNGFCIDCVTSIDAEAALAAKAVPPPRDPIVERFMNQHVCGSNGFRDVEGAVCDACERERSAKGNT